MWTWPRSVGAPLACASGAALVFTALLVHAWGAVGRVGDDGIRVRPVSRTGLVVTAVLPKSPAAVVELPVGSAIDGVDGLVTRDERELLRAFAARPPGRESTLHVQDITPGGGTGAGMGATRVLTVRPRPRLSTPSVTVGLRSVALAGAAALAAALIASRRPSGGHAAWWTLVAASGVAGLMLVRVYAEAGHASWLVAPVLLVLLAAATVPLAAVARRRRLILMAALVAAGGGTSSLLLAVGPTTGLDPRATAIAADVGLALLAVIPVAAALSPIRSVPTTSVARIAPAGAVASG